MTIYGNHIAVTADIDRDLLKRWLDRYPGKVLVTEPEDQKYSKLTVSHDLMVNAGGNLWAEPGDCIRFTKNGLEVQSTLQCTVCNLRNDNA